MPLHSHIDLLLRSAGLIAAVLLLCPSVALSSTGEVAVVEQTHPVHIEGLPFSIGEKLSYRIIWGRLPVGAAEASSGWTEDEGRPMIVIRSRARSNRIIKRLYPVDSKIETLIDPETLLPVRFTKDQREGRRRTHEVTNFDYIAGVARQHNVIKDTHIEFSLEPNTRDLLSFMYFVRGENFTPGSNTKHRVMADEKIYDLAISTVRQERIKTADGERHEAFLLEPEAAFEGLFVRSGRMWLWVSKAKPVTILRAEVEVPLARVKLILDPEADVDQQE